MKLDDQFVILLF